MLVLWKKTSKKEAERLKITEDLQKIAELIELSEAGFNEISDDDLLDAAIYERSALMARHSYLIKELKRLEGEGTE